MQTFDHVARLAAGLPEVTEGQERHRGHRTWDVGGLREALVDGWLAVAPRPLADRYLAR